MTFNEFLKLFPSGSGLPPLQPSADLKTVEDHLARFVAPDIKEREDARSKSPQVVIVSASGAVGKTTVARELSCHFGAPLWDLSKAGPVGKDSLVGKLHQVFGPKGLSDLSLSLDAGRQLIVADALDEARMKVTEEGFGSFVTDVGEMAKRSKGCSFILLGRSVVAETTWFHLMEAGARAAIFVIEPFSDAQSEEYLYKKILSLRGPGSEAIVRFPGPYTKARDLLLSNLRLGIKNCLDAPSEAEIRSFIGYAPVLDAVATLFSQRGNFVELERELTAMVGGSQQGHTQLLMDVVESIAKRERSEKLEKNLAMTFDKAKADPKMADHVGDLYAAPEQCARVLAHITKVPLSLPIPMEPKLREEYETRVGEFVKDHPFVGERGFANKVFEAYVYCRALLQNVGGFAPVVEERLSKQDYMPSRLLGDFYLMLRDRLSAGEVPAKHVGFIYDSMISADTADVYVRASFDGDEALDVSDSAIASEIDCELQFVRLDGAPLGEMQFSAKASPKDEIAFRSSIRCADVTVPCGVCFGLGLPEFEIGPGVRLSCRRLRFSCEHVTVGGKTQRLLEDPRVILEAQEFMQGQTDRPRVLGDTTLSVSWPGSESYPWNEYHTKHTAPDEGPELHEAYRRFRRIMCVFASRGYGELAKTERAVETERILRGKLGAMMLKQLMDDQVISLRSGMYFLQPKRADELLGVTWLQLRKGESSAKLSIYLSDFLRRNPDLSS